MNNPVPFRLDMPPAVTPASPGLVPSTRRRPRIALVAEGTYPFYTGGVSLWCHQLISGMPDHRFTFVSLCEDGTERSTWDTPDNLTDLVRIPLWGKPPRGRRTRGPVPSFAAVHDAFLRALLRPQECQVGLSAAATDEFLSTMRELFTFAQRADLGAALVANDSIERMLLAWRAADVDGHHGRLTLRDAVVAADQIEHLLRPLSHPPVRADVCHLAMSGVSALVGMAAKWANGTPLVMSEHGVYLRERYLSLATEKLSHPVKMLLVRFHRALTSAAYRMVDVLAPHSSYNRRWQLYNGADPARMRTMYNGINPDDFPAAATEPADPTIVFVGRVDPLKDLHTLIRAFEIVHRELPGARLRMFGPVPEANKEYYASCVRLIAELGLTGVAVFEGRVPRQVDAYGAGHLVVLTSVSEGFPYTVVESMSTGRPQVCTNVGGVSEAVGDAGFVVPPRDHAAVAAACLKLLPDDELRRRLGAIARRRVLDMFTLDQWTDAYRDIYGDLGEVAG